MTIKNVNSGFGIMDRNNKVSCPHRNIDVSHLCSLLMTATS